MRIIIEQSLVWCGILGSMSGICIGFFYTSMPKSIIDFLISSDNIAMTLVFLGLIGVLFLLVNLIAGIHAYWFIRLFSPLLFIITASIMASLR